VATNSIWELEPFKPYAERWRQRQKSLAERKSYYNGEIYRGIREGLGWLAPRLYRGIKPLYLPLSRAVDVDAGIVPAGWALPEGAPQAWREAMAQVLRWSRWVTDGVLYVHYGAMYGVSGLKVVDVREARRVVIAPLDPMRFMLIESSEYDSTPCLAFYVEERQDAQGRFEYGEVIGPSVVLTFRGGQPYGFGGRDPDYTNELGFVPFLEVQHINTGEELGEATFTKAIPLLNEVNELASYLADIIKKHAEPQWAVIGAEASDLVKSGDNVWFVPGSGDVKPVVAGIDVEGVLEFVREIRDQVKGALPEMAFDELRNKENIAPATLELQLMELVVKIQRVRPNYDTGLVTALRLAGRAAVGMGLADVAVLDNEALALDGERPVLPLDPLTQMQLESMGLALERQRALGIQEGQ
jgi:hypothetical protein